MARGESDIERIIAWGLASDPATVAAAMTEMYTRDLRPVLDGIVVPTLTLASWAGYAPYASRETVSRLYRSQYATLAGFRLEISDTARHFIMWDEPDWTFARIEDFLAATGS
jgi:pimeloyl-ACP methyl ester carboxylesterase